MNLRLKHAPAAPTGKRVLIRPAKPEEKTEGGLVVPDIAKNAVYAGVLVAAGDQAADILHDAGFQIGDRVWHAKYAGVLQEWHRMLTDDPACPHDGTFDIIGMDDKAWDRFGVRDAFDAKLRKCRACGSYKLQERMIVADVDDCMLNEDLQARFEEGRMRREMKTNEDGRNIFVVDRMAEPNTFEIKHA